MYNVDSSQFQSNICSNVLFTPRTKPSGTFLQYGCGYGHATTAMAHQQGLIVVSSGVSGEEVFFDKINCTETQMQHAFETAISGLENQGCRLEDVAKVAVWLKQASAISAFQRAYMTHFGWLRPSRSIGYCAPPCTSQIVLDVIAYKRAPLSSSHAGEVARDHLHLT